MKGVVDVVDADHFDAVEFGQFTRIMARNHGFGEALRLFNVR